MKHIFKLLKTSWGIVVLIDVEEIIDEKVLLYDIAITDTIFLKLNWQPSPYKQEVVQWLGKAISDFIKLFPLSKKICFNITELDFVETDFQEEGLYYVMLEWLAKRYNFQLPPLDAYYDKETNKYIFPSLI